jgi:poly [ADP-ribose] polymerase
MPMTAQTLMYVLTDANANNNKFWEINRDETGRISTRNGRVGTSGQNRVLGDGDTLFNAKIREKERKGFTKNTL